MLLQDLAAHNVGRVNTGAIVPDRAARMEGQEGITAAEMEIDTPPLQLHRSREAIEEPRSLPVASNIIREGVSIAVAETHGSRNQNMNIDDNKEGEEEHTMRQENVAYPMWLPMSSLDQTMREPQQSHSFSFGNHRSVSIMNYLERNLSRLKEADSHMPVSKRDLGRLFKYFKLKHDSIGPRAPPTDPSRGSPRAIRRRKRVGKLRILPLRRPHPKKKLASQIRRFAMDVMGRKSRKDMIRVVSADEQAAYQRLKRGGLTFEDFRLFLAGRNRYCAWNQRAADIFAVEFVKREDAFTTDVEVVRLAFLHHIHALCKQLEKLQEDYPSETDGIIAQQGRRNTLAQRRLASLSFHEAFAVTEKWILCLGTDGMSIDEADYRDKQNVRYKALQLPWRSKELRDYLCALDAIQLSTHFTKTGKRLPGALPRTRYLSKKIDHETQPVRGLPLNFYDADWLKSLSREERNLLMIETAVDLKIPDSLKDIVNQFKARDPKM
ncbi:hypothetical protein NM688_g7199 [Phlebia brevispora]|uniref:Uncharacterized protein n=1 Tax=Phlebia brevispora TaxID=194682 RepID=A0ACC1S894_9APHY|nr:hypothetical protein NM688_g7199 [Phlebia brevispora]